MAKTKKIKIEDIRKAKIAFKEAFDKFSEVGSIGIGDGTLKVVVTTEKMKNLLPATVEGVPLEVTVIPQIDWRNVKVNIEMAPIV